MRTTHLRGMGALASLLVPAILGAQVNGGGNAPNGEHERESRRLTVAAAAVAAPVRLDGILDDPVWRKSPPVSGFIQAEPDEGRPATERTEVWIAVDATTLYVAARLLDGAPDALVVSDIRKDFRRDNQDTFEVILDTFADRRNGYVFATNPAGARADEQVTNEGRETNTSWDAPWSVRTRRTAEGWTVEMAIPLRSIRSGGGDDGIWGINFSRRIRRKNEVDYWAPIPRAYTLARLSLAGNLVGLSSRGRGRDVRLTPYALARTVREIGGTEYDEGADAGVDAKIGVTRGLTLDLTANPDFAQAEADEQQVNLTQFSQFFPEKRDFFLENSGLFYIGDTPRNRRVFRGPTGNEDLVLFFSRRMGLGLDDRPVGIDGGLRLTGQEAGIQIGALALRTRDRDTIPGSDYAVVRVRHNIFANSDVGAVFMMRSAVEDRGDFNRLYGVDANLRLPAEVDWSTFAVTTETDGLTGSRAAVQTSFTREGDFDHEKVGVLYIGENFNDELGFLRRTGVRVWTGSGGVRPRPAALRARGIRELHPHVDWDYKTDQAGERVGMRLHNGFSVFLNNGGFGEVSVNARSERLDEAFSIDPNVADIAPGRYDWVEYQLLFNTDASRRFSASATGAIGGLWSGTQRSIRGSITWLPSFHFRGTVGVQRTAGNLAGPGGEFVRQIWTLRLNYSFNTNMFVDALAQYDVDRDAFDANIRFNLIHHPLSNLYVVYNEQRSTTPGGPVPGRSIVVKLTQMLSF